MTYPEVYGRLNFELAVITFFKKDGTIRLMLGTRNLSTVKILYGFQGGALGGHDKRCNISNGNIAVFDMAIGEARSFHIDRLIDIKWLGVVSSKEQYDKLFDQYIKYKEQYEGSKTIELDDI